MEQERVEAQEDEEGEEGRGLNISSSPTPPWSNILYLGSTIQRFGYLTVAPQVGTQAFNHGPFRDSADAD